MITDQTVLAILPVVILGAIATVAGLYFARKERRESVDQEANRRQG